MMLAATERTTQVSAASVPRMCQKANFAASAGNDTVLQFGIRLERRLQCQLILPD